MNNIIEFFWLVTSASVNAVHRSYVIVLVPNVSLLKVESSAVWGGRELEDLFGNVKYLFMSTCML